MNLEADAACLLSEIEALALLSEAEPPVVTRIVFTPADMRARAWLIERCKTAGLSVRQDAVGKHVRALARFRYRCTGRWHSVPYRRDPQSGRELQRR